MLQVSPLKKSLPLTGLKICIIQTAIFIFRISLEF
jgi:hypothetical protein